MKRQLFPLIFLAIILNSCKKDEPVYQKSGTGGVVYSDAMLDFKLFANKVPLVPERFYKNSSGDSFSVYKFNYYISNIKLTRTDGFIYQEKDVYRLVRHMEDDESFIMKKIPLGKYRQIEFLIGVDSIRNVSGIQTGALDPANNMFWDWNTGYIFFKMEGRYSTSTQTFKDDYAIHIGGFRGPNSCLQKTTITFDTLLNVRTDHLPVVHIATAAEEVFKNPHEIGFDYYYSNISERTLREVSENYRDMFSVRHMEN